MLARTFVVAGTPSRGDNQHRELERHQSVRTADIASLHRSAIEELAADSHSPIGLVEEVYRNELTMLEPQAKIHIYLPLIVRRRARDVLRQRQESIKISHRQSDQVAG